MSRSDPLDRIGAKYGNPIVHLQLAGNTHRGPRPFNVEVESAPLRTCEHEDGLSIIAVTNEQTGRDPTAQTTDRTRPVNLSGGGLHDTEETLGIEKPRPLRELLATVFSYYRTRAPARIAD